MRCGALAIFAAAAAGCASSTSSSGSSGGSSGTTGVAASSGAATSGGSSAGQESTGGGGSSGGAAAADGGLSSSFFGISVNDYPNDAWPVPAAVPFPTAGKPASSAYWAQVEPDAGAYDWKPIDTWLDDGKAAGVTTFLYTFFLTPQWASSQPDAGCSTQGLLGCAAPPTSLSDYTDFVSAVVTRYKGQIQYYEIWNEPNVPSEWSGTVQQMVSMAEAAYPIIKSIDPMRR